MVFTGFLDIRNTKSVKTAHAMRASIRNVITICFTVQMYEIFAERKNSLGGSFGYLAENE